jgi:hypothetical protein
MYAWERCALCLNVTFRLAVRPFETRRRPALSACRCSGPQTSGPTPAHQRPDLGLGEAGAVQGDGGQLRSGAARVGRVPQAQRRQVPRQRAQRLRRQAAWRARRAGRAFARLRGDARSVVPRAHAKARSWAPARIRAARVNCRAHRHGAAARGFPPPPTWAVDPVPQHAQVPQHSGLHLAAAAAHQQHRLLPVPARLGALQRGRPPAARWAGKAPQPGVPWMRGPCRRGGAATVGVRFASLGAGRPDLAASASPPCLCCRTRRALQGERTRRPAPPPRRTAVSHA